MVDAKKVIKGLENCIATSDRACPDNCPYYSICWDSSKGGELLYYSLMKDALELLKGQPEIVRCKDCKYAKMTIDGDLCKYCELDEDENGFLREVYHDAEWFCGDGERK